jgi:hypothetical protein
MKGKRFWLLIDVRPFDLDWDGYDLDGSKPSSEEVLYWYAKARDEWQEALQGMFL